MGRSLDDIRDKLTDDPRPGFFKIQLLRPNQWIEGVHYRTGSPWLPAAIWRPCPIEFVEGEFCQWVDRWYGLLAMRDADSFGRLREPCEVDWLWQRGVEIDMTEFQYWISVRQHIRLHDPDAMDADPRKRIDLSKAAPIGPRKR